MRTPPWRTHRQYHDSWRPPPRSPRHREDYKAHHHKDMPPPKQCDIVIRDNAEQTRHDGERNQGHRSRSHHDPPRPTSNRERREASQEGNSKKANPPPRPPSSPPRSHHGGGGPRRSRSPSRVDKKKNPEPYNALHGSIRSTRPGKNHTWDHVALYPQYGPQITPKVSGLTRPSSPMTAPPSQPHGCRTTTARWRLPEATPTSPSSNSH